MCAVVVVFALYVLDGIFGINMIELWGARKQDSTAFTKDSNDANTNLIPPVVPLTTQ